MALDGRVSFCLASTRQVGGFGWELYLDDFHLLKIIL